MNMKARKKARKKVMTTFSLRTEANDMKKKKKTQETMQKRKKTEKQQRGVSRNI